MKKVLVALCIILLGITTSCIGATYAETREDALCIEKDVTYTTVITYGTPYYYNGVISYYVYRNMYYYPYYWNNTFYFRPYSNPKPAGFVYHPRRFHEPIPHLGKRPVYHNYNRYEPPRRESQPRLTPKPQITPPRHQQLPRMQGSRR